MDDPTANLRRRGGAEAAAGPEPRRGEEASRRRRAVADPIPLRDRALLEVMYACGLRASEATGLEVTDVDLRRGFVRARGKGSKERIVPLGREAASALRRYLQRGRPSSSARAASASSSSTSAAGR